MTRLALITGLLAPGLILSGCAHDSSAHPEPVIVPIEVAIPTATGCVPPNLAAAPDYPDTDTALRGAPDAAGRYQLLFAGRKVRAARLNEIEPIVAGCPKATSK